MYLANPTKSHRAPLVILLGLLVIGASACGSSDEPGAPDASTNMPDAGGGATDAAVADAADQCTAPDGGIGLPCMMATDCPCNGACASGSCVAPLLCNQALINWTGPTENEDGTCLTDLGGFRLYWSTVEATFLTDQMEDLMLPCIDGETVACGPAAETVVQKICSHRLTDLPDGTIYIGLTSYNAVGVESTPAGPVTKIVDCP